MATIKKRLAYPCEYFSNIDDYKNCGTNLKKTRLLQHIKKQMS